MQWASGRTPSFTRATRSEQFWHNPFSAAMFYEVDAIAAERVRSGAADHAEGGAEALASLGIKLPEG